MYKTITHTIREEHFDHPMVIPSAVSCNSAAYSSNFSINSDAPLPPYVMTEETMLFRMDSRTLWARYTWSLLNYAISLNSSNLDSDIIKGRLIKNAYHLGDFIIPYYGTTAGNDLGEKLAAIGTTGALIANNVKNDTSIDDLVSGMNPLIDDISQFLNGLNPINWPVGTLVEYFTGMVNYWVDELVSRNKKDWVANEIAINRLSRLMISGVTNSTALNSVPSTSDIFSKGVIAQFPRKFAIVVTE
jgi:hypothetical protein